MFDLENSRDSHAFQEFISCLVETLIIFQYSKKSYTVGNGIHEHPTNPVFQFRSRLRKTDVWAHKPNFHTRKLTLHYL
jgi:hypothetical protein